MEGSCNTGHHVGTESQLEFCFPFIMSLQLTNCVADSILCHSYFV